MKKLKNRVESFDMFVRLDEQMDASAGTADSTTQMVKTKLKSAAYNASSALSLMENNPGVVVDPYILAQIAVAADYLDKIEEFFRSYESGDASAALPTGEDDAAAAPAPMEDEDSAEPTEGEGEGADDTDDTEGGEPAESTDGESEDETRGRRII